MPQFAVLHKARLVWAGTGAVKRDREEGVCQEEWNGMGWEGKCVLEWIG